MGADRTDSVYSDEAHKQRHYSTGGLQADKTMVMAPTGQVS